MKNEVNRTLVVKTNNVKKSLLALTLAVISITASAETFSASEINATTTKSGITVSQNSCSSESQQICKENNKGVKETIIKCGNTANNVDEKYVEISSASDISTLRLRATTNNSSAKQMAFLYWGNVTPAVDNVSSAALISFGSYDGACDANYVDVNVPAGVRIIRIYRQVKNFNGTAYEKNKTYGEGNTYHLAEIQVTAGPPPASTDATLSSLTYNGTSVPNFDPNTTTYDVELPTGTTAVPTVAATKNNSKALDPVISAATSLPGATTVTVTAEDGTTTKTYTINFSVASAYPKVLTATWTNIAGQAVIDQANKTITGKVAQGTGLTAITPSFTGNNIASWTPQGAQNFSNGAVEYTFSAQTGEVTVYNITITEVPVVHPNSVSLDKSSLNLSIGGSSDLHATVLPADATDPSVSWSSSNTAVATVNNNGHVTALTAGTTTITVTTTDGGKTATCTVTVTAGPPVPPTSLTTHVPEIYEAKDITGGYNTPLTVVAGREYEVYYTQRTGEGDYPTFSTTLANEGKSNGISGSTTKTKNVGRPGDTWFEGTITEHSECKNASSEDEFVFATKMIREHRLSSTNKYQFHIKGYDQFSFWGMDKKLDPKNGNQVFVVKIDGVVQTTAYSTDKYTIRRYDITTAEHLIEISTTEETGTNKCVMGGFSLRVAQEPRVKYLKGNDSTQSILQTAAIQPVVYTTKYNNIQGAETVLEWIGATATGIILTEKDGDLSDTLTLSGNANCATGEYNYAVVSRYNGVETNRVLGKFYVTSDIKSVTSTNATVYQNEEMDQIEFKYYALSADSVILTWTGTTPVGITGNGNNGTYLIGGTPTQTGEYTYSITVQGADTTITGKITVRELDYGTNPVLYLYKNENAYESDEVHNYLKKSGWNPIERKAKKNGLRPADQYAVYKLVVISEDVDANNPEVQQIIRDNGANKPVLNLKGFTYAKGEGLLGWGDPSNGAIDSTKNSKSKGTKIKIQHADHPIFNEIGSSAKEGSEISILSNYALQGVMPIAIDMQYITDQTLCMGTAPIRANSLDGYYEEGEWVAAIHEILPSARGEKYICLPLARNVPLTNTGEKLIKGIVNYLVSATPTSITAPDLLITKFAVTDSKNKEYTAAIDHTEHTITLRLTPEEYQALDSLKEAKPVITHPNYTSVNPASGEEVKLTYAYLRPQKYIITDFINKNVYNFILELYNPHQDLEETYEAGQWVNIFDIYGRKVTTTNEDIYTMELPHGMYIIVTESGETMKIMK